MIYAEVGIYYGSQTGTAAEAALSLYHQCLSHGFPATIRPLTALPSPAPSLAIFLVSTTGDGLPPRPVTAFWTQLMSPSLPSTYYAAMEYTVFGLGDSSYQRFNQTARQLWVRLSQLGANSFYRKGLGDEQHDFEYEGEFDPWTEGLWQVLSSRVQGTEIRDRNLKYWIVRNQENSHKFTNRGRFQGQILSKTRITQGENEIYKLQIASQAAFSIGDTCDIYPTNSPTHINQLISLLNLNTTQNIQVKSADFTGIDVDFRTNWEELVGKWMDLHKEPSRRGVEMLLSYTTDSTQREKLQSMIEKTTTGRSDFYRYITKEKRCLCEVLWDFRSISSLNLPDLLEITGLISPRSYSISSLPSSGYIELVISIKQSITPFNRTITGLCSQYIQRIQYGESINLDISAGTLPLPPSDVDVVVVACGAGIAAFWSLLQLRVSQNIGGNVVFYGCRNSDSWVYREEMMEMERKGLARVEVVFSRVERTRRYVQHRIHDRAEVVAEALVVRDAWVYVCGNGRGFPSDVESALLSTLTSHFDFSPSEAQEFLTSRKSSGKYHLECW